VEGEVGRLVPDLEFCHRWDGSEVVTPSRRG
jgi:hypothetical protein